MSDDDRIDLDGLAKFMEEHPFHMSPEELLEAAIEECVEEPVPPCPYVPYVREAGLILDQWIRLEECGEGLSTEQKKFEAEAFFTRHKFAGSEGYPLPHQKPRPARN